MKEIHSDVIQFRGTHYDFGYYQGQLLRNSWTINNREKQWKLRKPRFEIDEQEAKNVFLKFAPRIWEELTGLRDALDWSMQRTLLEFGGYRLEYNRSGCSILTGENYFVRNYDYHPKTYEGRFVFFQPTDHGYAIAGPSQRITGRMDGINEKGLVLGYNFMHRKKPGDGFICNMIGRIVLETCANVEEAVSLLKEMPHRHSFSYIVYDKSSETYVVEACPRGVEVRKANYCTNHYEILQDENRNYLVDSYKRLEVMERNYQYLSSGKDAFQLLNGTEKGVFSNQYKNWSGTIHTSAYFPKEMEIWFALGGDQNPVTLNFKKWLNGENILMERIIGEIDTDLPFVHMEKAR